VLKKIYEFLFIEFVEGNQTKFIRGGENPKMGIIYTPEFKKN